MYGATPGGGGETTGEVLGITVEEVPSIARDAPEPTGEAKFFKPRYTTGRVLVGDLFEKVDDFPIHLNEEKPWEQLVNDAWELGRYRMSDPHWNLPSDKQALANEEMVVPPGYACYEYSEYLSEFQRYEIAEFDDHAIWAKANVRWNASANSKHGWWKQQAKRLTALLRHKAPLPAEKSNFPRVPMDRSRRMGERQRLRRCHGDALG